jgi:hypothetical protein
MVVQNLLIIMQKDHYFVGKERKHRLGHRKNRLFRLWRNAGGRLGGDSRREFRLVGS